MPLRPILSHPHPRRSKLRALAAVSGGPTRAAWDHIAARAALLA